MESRVKALASLLVPIISGALFVPGLAPMSAWPSTLLSIAALLYLMHRKSQQSAFFIGWLYGVGLFGAGVSWVYVSIQVHGQAPPLLAGTLTALFCLGLATLTGLQMALYRRCSRGRKTPSSLLFAAIWVLFEWLRSWLFTGFPWLYAGYIALDTPAAGWAPVVGVYGLSFLIAGLSAAIGSLALNNASTLRKKGAEASIWVIIILTGMPLSAVSWTQDRSAPLTVAIYQPNIPLEKKWDRRYFRAIQQQYTDNSRPYFKNTDLVLWPESALPTYSDRIEDYLGLISTEATETGTTLITGIPTRDAQGGYNSIIALGLGAGEYRKQKLVPFGEYVPFEENLRGLIQFFDLPMSNFIPGPNVPPILSAGPLKVASFICYEIVYPDFVWQGARDAALLVTVSNDSWFGHSIGPLQHLQMARFRALETGRPLLRGTNNGVSAIIDHKGDLLVATPQFEEVVITGEVQPKTGLTPLMWLGSTPILAFFGLLIVAAAYRRQR
ncbi:apolipoprotein N-acyltransferase [Luminiphilus sp.]|nr:apolipoprotein N-acyltransferase [Luminiphilus sp.]MDA8826459.1 apolipoprotein N-acyltransferase [Luminiphilus sp.]